MPTKSVATELQDATPTRACLIIDPYYPRAVSWDAHGDQLVHATKYIATGKFNAIKMSSVTVDGVYYWREGFTYGYYLFSSKIDDDGCVPDKNGYCDCKPQAYRPLPYRGGEICEACWLRDDRIVGVGKGVCPHN